MAKRIAILLLLALSPDAALSEDNIATTSSCDLDCGSRGVCRIGARPLDKWANLLNELDERSWNDHSFCECQDGYVGRFCHIPAAVCPDQVTVCLYEAACVLTTEFTAVPLSFHCDCETIDHPGCEMKLVDPGSKSKSSEKVAESARLLQKQQNVPTPAPATTFSPTVTWTPTTTWFPTGTILPTVTWSPTSSSGPSLSIPPVQKPNYAAPSSQGVRTSAPVVGSSPSRAPDPPLSSTPQPVKPTTSTPSSGVELTHGSTRVLWLTALVGGVFGLKILTC